MKIRAQLLAMAEPEILAMISPRTIRDIKREDPSPVFKVFGIGHEGESRPKVVGVGSTVQRWFRSAIEKLTEKLPVGAPAWHNHPAPGAQESRPVIGEVVAKALKNVEGTLSSIAAVYIYRQYRDLPLDVASIEADIMVPSDSREFDVRDVDVLNVPGIALGNSSSNLPAFPGATLIAQLQAFAEKPHQGDHKMTLDEIRKEIQEGKFNPSDVFSPAALTSDPFIKEHVEEKINNAKGYQIRKLQDAEARVTALETEKKSLQDELASSKTSVLKTRAKEAFDAVLVDRPKLKEDERLLSYVRSRVDKDFKPTDEAKLKDDLNRFVDGQVTEFHEIFGKPKEEPRPGDKPKAGSGREEAGGEENSAGLEELKKSDLFPKD